MYGFDSPECTILWPLDETVDMQVLDACAEKRKSSILLAATIDRRFWLVRSSIRIVMSIQTVMVFFS